MANPGKLIQFFLNFSFQGRDTDWFLENPSNFPLISISGHELDLFLENSSRKISCTYSVFVKYRSMSQTDSWKIYPCFVVYYISIKCSYLDHFSRIRPVFQKSCPKIDCWMGFPVIGLAHAPNLWLALQSDANIKMIIRVAICHHFWLKYRLTYHTKIFLTWKNVKIARWDSPAEW